MQYWLLKTEPATFSVEDLERAPRRTTGWDGVRNYQARNMLRDGMKRRDQAFLYHSSCEVPGIAGIVEVVKEGYPDPTAFDKRHHHYDPDSDPADPRWYMVDVKLVRRLSRVITLTELRSKGRELAGMVLLRAGNRLSVMPVDDGHWRLILALESRARGER
ncbi:MAG TPA: EVE domain-containing protein [Steroidobacteraceae bacterium]|nr:EVE domain-containing protein [Steroidobacteraceae bacterium]